MTERCVCGTPLDDKGACTSAEARDRAATDAAVVAYLRTALGDAISKHLDRYKGGDDD